MNGQYWIINNRGIPLVEKISKIPKIVLTSIKNYTKILGVGMVINTNQTLNNFGLNLIQTQSRNQNQNQSQNQNLKQSRTIFSNKILNGVFSSTASNSNSNNNNNNNNKIVKNYDKNGKEVIVDFVSGIG